ncbi:Bgt-3653 [Blumeria graminis f. sp. tritici]|uniref:Bgt-3653 n=3 Tax=Blumeria graminis TaxID=34373 RepID=A0A9X9MGL1_BLUGR|nr:hypothetical protein BGT96224_3653 [Blumeria graminis f. sp. tritici 96224]VDB86117.1 Bgt-3653 [Blumeria graminis f. sp. tritici]
MTAARLFPFKNNLVPVVFKIPLVSRSVPTRSHSILSPAESERVESENVTHMRSYCRDIAFGFDIDGVLLRESVPIPGASDTLKLLQKLEIPFVLVTNGGGKTEKDRVAELSEKLDIDIPEENFVQSHTPFKELVHGTGQQQPLENKTVLVTGGHEDRCRKVALNYGFKNVVTPADILMAHPKIWPFKQVFMDYYKQNHKPLPVPINVDDLSSSLKIDAIFVFNDPRDWALDTQIILDLLLSKEGFLGTYSEKNGDSSLPNNGWQQDKQPLLFFSNPDLFWATSYHLPRLGQGGFVAAFNGVWNATTNNATLSKTVVGKPHTITFDYAENFLYQHRLRLLGSQAPPLKQVWFVGDNELTDIQGANTYQSRRGIDWRSILVSTGVYNKDSVPKCTPNMLATNVQEAVQRVINIRMGVV